MQEEITIIGAGLTGLMLSIYLARRGYRVNIYDQRPDPREGTYRYDRSRSMSIDLSSRGLLALAEIGLDNKILSYAVPMKNRIIHLPNGELISLAYGKNEQDHINTISRTQIHQDLLRTAELFSLVTVHFNQRFVDIDIQSGVFTLFNEKTKVHHHIRPFLLFGCDGTNSVVRKCIEREYHIAFNQSYFSYCYKELTIPASAHENLTLEAMHMWPRQNCMLVAQPNYNHSFTCALLLPSTGDYCFENMIHPHQPQKIVSFFKSQFADVCYLIPELQDELINNPIGSLVTINEGHWNIENKVLLIGDSVHAMVPFFGQGLNCCFEDCYLLNQFLNKYNDDWKTVIPAFERTRKIDTNAITMMSLENYPELIEPDWQQCILQRKIENYLMTNFKDTYTSYHNLVCFNLIPYSDANSIRILQNELIRKILSITNNIEEINKEKVQAILDEYQKDIKRMMPD